MFSPLSLCIASRFSRGKKRNSMVSFISISSILGIALGVCVIIVGLSAMNGFEQELKTRVLGVIPHAELDAMQSSMTNWPLHVKEAQQDPHVISATPYINFIALAEKGNKLKALQVKGIQASSSSSLLPKFITDDAWYKLKPHQNMIILGQGIAKTLNVTIGQWITLMVPSASHQGQIAAPKRIRVKVAGLIALGGQIDHGLALIPLADAQDYANLGKNVSGIELRFDDPFQANTFVREAGNRITSFVYLHSWLQKYGNLYSDIQMIRVIMYLVMILIIGVACFNIISTLMMLVKDRAGDIAILRTMGASNRTIRSIFIWQGMITGISGGLVGSILGIIISLNLTFIVQLIENITHHQFLSSNIYFINFIPSQLIWSDVFIVSGMAIFLSLLATLYPAKRANKLQPAVILRTR